MTPGLAGACVVSFGSSGNLTPVERKAGPAAGCLSTCWLLPENPCPLLFYQSIPPHPAASPILQFPGTCNNPEPRPLCLGVLLWLRAGLQLAPSQS